MEAAEALAKAAFSAYGKIEAVKNAKTDFLGKDGRYSLSVEGGKIVEMRTEPVLFTALLLIFHHQFTPNGFFKPLLDAEYLCQTAHPSQVRTRLLAKELLLPKSQLQ